MKENYLFWENPDSIAKLQQVLSENKLVVGSSDTVFGLLANTTQAGFASLNSVKERKDKPYIVLIGNIDKLKHFVAGELSLNILNLLNFCWPGPLTMIFRAKEDLPEYLVSQDNKIALRIPQHDGLLRLLENFDGLFSTSANLSGQRVPGFIENVDTGILDQVEEVVLDQYTSGYANTSQPSTILDCSTGQIEVIREGAYSIDSLKRVYDGSIL